MTGTPLAPRSRPRSPCAISPSNAPPAKHRKKKALRERWAVHRLAPLLPTLFPPLPASLVLILSLPAPATSPISLSVPRSSTVCVGRALVCCRTAWFPRPPLPSSTRYYTACFRSSLAQQHVAAAGGDTPTLHHICSSHTHARTSTTKPRHAHTGVPPLPSGASFGLDPFPYFRPRSALPRNTSLAHPPAGVPRCCGVCERVRTRRGRLVRARTTTLLYVFFLRLV